jgi:hypothetical protein
MQTQKVMSRMKKLEKEMQELRCNIYSNIKVSGIKSKKEMHKAAQDFLKLKDIPDKPGFDSVEMIRSERKHARGY